eukprot:TRINITY_DN10318_c0_g2_i1.p2 TRINITY_DN10318_c0_g2~~TRINITY_DN10318_c0_g2_i1.p2  ORF type:complete len:512 (-),score=113.21 TRINITY_DN10318_c0_g2_i1:200-1651(-)
MSQYSDAEVAGFLDVEGHTPVQPAASQPQRSWKVHHVLAAIAGAAVVGTSGALLLKPSNAAAATTNVAAAAKGEKLTARSLFASPAIHDVATENVMNIKSHLPRSTKSREQVRHLVGKTFGDIVENVRQTSPELYAALEKTELTQDHHDGIVHMMRYLKDPRVMRIGVDTAKAMQEAQSDDEEVLKAHIKRKLKGRAKEIQEIYMAMPASLQDVATSRPGEGFKSIFDPKKRQALKTLGGKWYEEFTQDVPMAVHDETDRRLVWGHPAYSHPAYAHPAATGMGGFMQPATRNNMMQPMQPMGAMYNQPVQHSWVQHVPHPYKVAEEALSIVGTAFAEADTMLRMINPLEKVMPGGHDLKIPPWVTTAIGGGDFLFQNIDCELDAVADGNVEEGVGCPMMSASAGFDMMREPFTLFGLLGDNNPGNGAQGNHAGHSAKQGIFNDNAGGKQMKLEAAGHWPICMFWGNCNQAGGTATTGTAAHSR